MIGTALGLFLLGLLLSTFFSGAETGFYRVARMRLALDALGGDLVARGLFWFSRRPSLFVATTLLGNNVANYLVSLATVLAAQALFSPENHAAELLLSLALAPVLFVLGELLPKNLFLHAPNRLLRRAGPLFFVFAVLFAPVSLPLWGLNRLLARLVGRRRTPVRLVLARRELERLLEEGHEMGILRPAQRELAQGLFAVAGQPVGPYATPIHDIPRARSDMTADDVLGLARRYHLAFVCVEETGPERRLAGYVRVIDLRLWPRPGLPVRPLVRVAQADRHLDVLIRMQAAHETLAEVVDAEGRSVGILTLERLREPLLHHGRP